MQHTHIQHEQGLASPPPSALYQPHIGWGLVCQSTSHSLCPKFKLSVRHSPLCFCLLHTQGRALSQGHPAFLRWAIAGAIVCLKCGRVVETLNAGSQIKAEEDKAGQGRKFSPVEHCKKADEKKQQTITERRRPIYLPHFG